MHKIDMTLLTLVSCTQVFSKTKVNDKTLPITINNGWETKNFHNYTKTAKLTLSKLHEKRLNFYV